MSALPLRHGSSGALVRQWQQMLIDAGYNPGPMDGSFGPRTEAATSDAQAAAGLAVTGETSLALWDCVAGHARANTAAAHIPAVPAGLTPFQAALVAAATGYIGVRERGRNAGPDVEAFQRSTGNSRGDAWCASFVYKCADDAARDIGGKNPLYRTASTIAMLAEYRRRGWTVDRGRAGDIFIIRKTATTGHTGIITGPAVGGFYPTIEGNTDGSGSREGDGVYRGRRDADKITMIVRVP